MPAPQLDGSWAKLERAKAHIETLRGEIREATKGDPKTIPLRRQFEAESQAVVYRTDSLPKVRDGWGLLIGDALHNFRCSLDHAWWQLATRRLGREPTEKEAKAVQFPILSNPAIRINRSLWTGHRFLKYVYRTDATKIETLQPYKHARKPNELHPLDALATLSNVDKHQVVHAVLYVASTATIRAPGPEDFRDCTRLLRTDTETGEQSTITVFGLDADTGAGDKVVEVYVQPTGSNPDVELNASLTGYIAFNETWDVMNTLDWIGEWCAIALTRLDPVF